MLNHGVDNTGTQDISSIINTLCSTYTGRKIYFPAGRYKINNTIIIRTDGNYRGNVLVGEPNTLFITDGVDIMIQFGNGGYASTLEKFGLDQIYIDASNVTKYAVYVQNNQYSGAFNNVLIRNVGDIVAFQLGSGTGTSSQTYISNLVITGDGSCTGQGLYIESTDNYLINVDIGRLQHNLVLSGGGNLLTNIHTWNYGYEYEALSLTTSSQMHQYSSIMVNGSNTFANVQIDNGSPAVELRANAVNNIFNGITFNYEEDFPWATQESYDCRSIYVNNGTTSYNSSFEFNGIVFSPKDGNKISLMKFYDYSQSSIFATMHHWKLEYNATRENKLKCMPADWALTIYNTSPILSYNFNVTDTSKCSFLGYIGANFTNIGTVYEFYDKLQGYIEITLRNTGGSVTIINNTIHNSFANNCSLLISKHTTTVNGYTVIPIYIQYHNTGTIQNGLLCNPKCAPDTFNSFIPVRTYSEIDVPDDIHSISCYSS